MTVLTLMHDGFGRGFVEFLMRARPQYWLARLYLNSSILITISFAWILPVSAQRIALDNVGLEAWVLLGGVALLASIGVLDGIVNDLMPERFHVRWADRHRHQILMVQAAMLWGIVWLQGLHAHELTLVVLRYALDGSFCVAIAVLDTLARVKQVRRDTSRQG